MKRLRKWLTARLADLKAVAYLPLVAAAIVWRRTALRHTTVIAITGSVGKTTARDCLAAILSRLGPTMKARGSANGRRGLPWTILRARPSHRFLVLEAGILKPGRMWRSAFMIRPDIAVITAVNWQHARSFDSLDHIASEKAKMLGGLSRSGLAVLNADDSRVAAMNPGQGRGKVTFGLGAQANVRGAVEESAWPRRLALTVSDENGSALIRTQLIGPHWATSVLAAVAVARRLGATWEQCADGLTHTPPHVGRLDPVTLPSGAVLLRDEYNGSWATLERALQVMQQASAERKIIALGHILDAPHLGDDPVREIARRVARVADLVLVWGSHRERFQSALAEERPELPLRTFEAQAELAAALRNESRPGDVILLKGYWFDHLTRVVYGQFGSVACGRSYCAVTSVCDSCPKLGFTPDSDADPRLLGQLAAWRAARAQLERRTKQSRVVS